MSDALQILRTRRSVREFDSNPISQKDLETIVEAARLAPTANNKQPWELVVITDRAMLQKLAGICEYGKFLAHAPAAVVVLSHDIKYFLEDGSAITTYILLASWALGIGSCWIAGDKKDYARTIAELMGAPNDVRLISIVALGYPKKTPPSDPPSSKRPLTDVLHWESYRR